MNNKTKRIITIAVLVAFCVVLSAFDNLISSGVFGVLRAVIPSLKIGLANIVIMLFILRFKTLEGLLSIALKSIIVSLLFTGITGFVIGFSGTLISFLVMSLLKKMLKEDKYIIFISSIGAVAHIVGQIVAAFVLYGINDIRAFLLYAPYLMIISIVSGIVMGFISSKAIKLLDNTKLIVGVNNENNKSE